MPGSFGRATAPAPGYPSVPAARSPPRAPARWSPAMLLLSLLLPAFGAPDAQARTDGPPTAPDTVGVIALRDIDGTLTTLRVDSRTGLTLVGPGVYVPRADGWWRLQAGRISVDPRYSFGWTAAAPVTRPVLVPAPEDPCGPPVDGMVYEAGTVADVVFVSPEWLVVEASGGMDCGGAHPTAWDDLVAGPLGEAGVTEARTFADVFGADAARVYRQAGMRARAQSADPECFERDPRRAAARRSIAPSTCPSPRR